MRLRSILVLTAALHEPIMQLLIDVSNRTRLWIVKDMGVDI